MKEKQTQDEETKAIAKLVRDLQKLEAESRERVIQYLHSRFCRPSAPPSDN
jgi:hypothetical protein